MDLSKIGKCPICGQKLLAKSFSNITSVAFFFNCEKCGKFHLMDDLFNGTESPKLPIKLRSCLYYYFANIHKPIKNIFPYFVNTDAPPDFFDEFQVINTNSLLNLFPKTYEDQISMILVNLSKLTGFPGEVFILPSEEVNQAPIFFLPSDDIENYDSQIDWWKNVLKESGYLKIHSLDGNQLEITVNGLIEASRFIKAKPKSKTCFIAMWFDPSLYDARSAIQEAVRHAGYVPVLIDLKEHINQIVPEILYEIRESRFVIADFTGHRGGVYYEAGYAEGFGIPVLATCRKDYFDEMHFDLKQKNTIKWENEESLKLNLVKRIIATVGYGANP